MAQSRRRARGRRFGLPRLQWLSERLPAPRVEKSLFWGLIALITLAPIPLGGNRPWAWAFLHSAAFLLLAVWLQMWALGKASFSEPFRRAWPVHLLFAAWLLIHLAQMVALPPGWVAVLSPESAAHYAQTNAFTDPARWIPLSVEVHATRVAATKSAAYFALFALVLLLVTNRKRLKTLAYAVVIAGLVLSLYGVMMHLAEITQEWFGTVIQHGASASATYPNRNHFAGWLEMSLAIGIGLLIADLRDKRYETWRHFARAMIELVFSPKIRLRLYLSVMVIALVTTHSRMGNTAFFASLIIAGVIGLAMTRHAPRGTAFLLASLVAIDLFIVGSWFGVEKLAKRIEQTTVQEFQLRQDPSDFVFSQINDFPLLGSGAGTFYVVFPKYRGENVVNYYDYAHNDYAQIAAEMGWFGFGIAALLVLASFAAALRAQWTRSDPLARGMAFASLMGMTAILIHSWVDFNLQIPANAQLFVVLMALAWLALHLERRKPSSTPKFGSPDMRAPSQVQPVVFEPSDLTPPPQDGRTPQADPG
jgi:putative inorganic carbon (hco3(-)) transporter